MASTLQEKFQKCLQECCGCRHGSLVPQHPHPSKRESDLVFRQQLPLIFILFILFCLVDLDETPNLVNHFLANRFTLNQFTHLQ
jgi:hypothetical protein